MKRLPICLAAAIVAMSASGVARAQDKQDATMRSFADMTCGELLSQLLSVDMQNSLQFYAFGFFNGANVMANAAKGRMREVNAITKQSVLGATYTGCSTNKSQLYATVLTNYYSSLPLMPK